MNTCGNMGRDLTVSRTIGMLTDQPRSKKDKLHGRGDSEILTGGAHRLEVVEYLAWSTYHTGGRKIVSMYVMYR